MDREYLEDYEQKEKAEFGKLWKRIKEDKFSFGSDRYPPDERYVKLQKPVALAHPRVTTEYNIWSQIPFCGSLILLVSPLSKDMFEETYFKTSKIPEIIDFIKDSGRLQVALNAKPTTYDGLDFLDPIFEELNPPFHVGLPLELYGSTKEIREYGVAFFTLAKFGFVQFIQELSEAVDSRGFYTLLDNFSKTYQFLKLGRYAIVEDIENLMVDDPIGAGDMLGICHSFIVSPTSDLRYDIKNDTFEQVRATRVLPTIYQPQEIRFPCEIGRFLLKKLTYAAQDMRACYDLFDHYDSYDLQKVQESLNAAIVTNHPDIVNKSAEELSEILDDVWNDKTIPKRIKNIKIGVPVSIAAIGGVVGALVGGLAGVGTGGFLAELGFKVAERAVDKFFSIKGEGISEKLAKLRTKSYQANIYGFKKKYKDRIASELPSLRKQTPFSILKILNLKSAKPVISSGFCGKRLSP